MEWTKDTPKKPGYYWTRKNKYKAVNMVCIWVDHDESIAQENLSRSIDKKEEISRYSPIKDVSPENLVFYVRYVSSTLCDKENLLYLEEREWYGPLVAPEEF